MRRFSSRSGWLWRVVSVLAALAICCPAHGDQTAPRFTGTNFPEPPLQHGAWTPPKATSVPAIFADATTALINLGLPDPRNCEYRSIRIALGSIWDGGGSSAEVHGWVLPPPKDAKAGAQQYAIAWSGLIYPTLSVGDRANLRADVTAMCAEDEKRRKIVPKNSFGSEFDPYRVSATESGSASATAIFPIRICLLLRLNETALAEAAWKEWYARILANNDNTVPTEDPFFDLADNWLWLQYERAMAAHMRGEDYLALIDARAALELQPRLDAAARKRGYKKDDSNGVPVKTFFDFLNPAHKLFTDAQDRIKNPPIALDAILKIQDQKTRVLALVMHLNEACVRQQSQPGGIDLSGDTTVQALIREGDPAVEPLLDCLEKDDRLTRSVHFWRDFSHSRLTMGAHEAAFVALCALLDHSFFAPGSLTDDLSSLDDAQRKSLAKTVRDFWNTYKSHGREERWVAELADDQAGADTWVQAAANIMQPSNVEQGRSSMADGPFTVTRMGEKTEVAPGPPRGEVLRKLNNPSVSDLLAKRLKSLSRGGDDDANSDLRAGCFLAEILAAWDGANQKPALAAFSESLRLRFRRTRGTDAGAALVPHIVQIYEKRGEAGDRTALMEYASWLAKIVPADAAQSLDTIFEPFWKNPDNKDLADAAETIFNGQGSSWNPLLKHRLDPPGIKFDDLMLTQIVGIPAVRKQLSRELDDLTEVGMVSVYTGEYGGLNLKFAEHEMSTGMTDTADPLRPQDDKPAPFRVCDFIGYTLTKINGFPRFELYWPLAQRDEARIRTRQFLEKYGGRLAWSPMQDQLKQFMEGAPLTFPLRHRPATAPEAAAGDAIFFLEGNTRVWDGVKLPRQAKMTTLRTVPQVSQIFDMETRKTTSSRSWKQDGYVWQAEETMRNGRWTRFFGFVGPEFVGKVSADEIQFPADDFWAWSPFNDGIEWTLRAPGKHYPKISLADLHAGKALNVDIIFRDSIGVSRDVPTDWYHAADHQLRKGFELRLQYNGEDKWEELPAIGIMSFQPGDASATLSPTAEIKVATIDLRKVFKIEKSGDYQIHLIAVEPKPATTEPKSCAAQFIVDP